MKNKGAAAIIATVLLLMMAVAAAGVSYSWVMKMQKSIQKDTEDKYASDAAKTDAKLSIPSMWKDGTDIDFSLQNTGSYTFEDPANFNIYLDGVPVTVAITYDPSSPLIPGGVTTVSTGISFPAAAGDSKTIKIVADTGTSVVYMCTITTDGQSYC